MFRFVLSAFVLPVFALLALLMVTLAVPALAAGEYQAAYAASQVTETAFQECDAEHQATATKRVDAVRLLDAAPPGTEKDVCQQIYDAGVSKSGWALSVMSLANTYRTQAQGKLDEGWGHESDALQYAVDGNQSMADLAYGRALTCYEEAATKFGYATYYYDDAKTEYKVATALYEQVINILED